MKKKSEFGKLSGTDFLNALYHAVAASVVPGTLIISSGVIPTTPQIFSVVGTFIGAFFGSIFKSNYTNSDGQSFTKEV